MITTNVWLRGLVQPSKLLLKNERHSDVKDLPPSL